MAGEHPLVPRRRPHVAVFLCDMQEKFRNAIWEFDSVTLTAKKVIETAKALDIPVHTTEQNPSRLGPTVPELAGLLPADGPAIVAKSRFSMMVPQIRHRLLVPPAAAAAAASATDKENGAGEGAPTGYYYEGIPWTVAIVGIEAHICVTQTALDLRDAGYRPYVLADGVSSANCEEVPLALARLRAEPGVTVTTSESFLYEIMGDSEIPEFRAVLGVVKNTAGDTAMALRTLHPKM